MDYNEDWERYKPGKDFEEVKKDPLLDINVTDSTELWLIQWPLNQLKPADFQGKELSLKLRDRNMGTFESSSGKSYEVVNVGTKDPNATVFLPSKYGGTVVGNIARRVSLVRYPDPNELEKPRGLSTFALSNQNPKDAGYLGNTKLKRSTPTKSDVSKVTHSASHETQASAPKSRQDSSSHMKKRNDRSEGGSSHVTGTASTGSKSQATESISEDSSLEKNKKKKRS